MFWPCPHADAGEYVGHQRTRPNRGQCRQTLRSHIPHKDCVLDEGHSQAGPTTCPLMLFTVHKTCRVVSGSIRRVPSDAVPPLGWFQCPVLHASLCSHPLSPRVTARPRDATDSARGRGRTWNPRELKPSRPLLPLARAACQPQDRIGRHRGRMRRRDGKGTA